MEKTENKIGQDFSVYSLALFALPSFLTNTFAQIFKSLDDGLFISRYVGETALASLNIVNPLAGIQMAIEHLFSLGACNISAKLMGEGKQLEAKQVFSRICISSIVVASMYALLVNIFAKDILVLLGADEDLIYYALYQFRIVYAVAPITMLTRIFNCYYSTAGKPKMGTYCAVLNGVTNIVLDIILIVFLKLGVLGACIASAMGDVVVFIFGLFFFLNKNNEIYFVAPKGQYLKTSLASSKYALPQCINSLSFSATTYIANLMILKIIGSTGIAANAVISDVRKIITAGLIGFAVCIGPVVSYNYGSKNTQRLKKIFGHIVKIWAVGSLLITTLGLLLRHPLLSVFMSENTSQEFYDLTKFALTIELFATPFTCGSIIVSRFFIALGNSKTSIYCSVYRNLITKAIMYLLLPYFFGATGIWSAIPVSEFMAFLFSAYLIYINADNYGYGKSGVAYLIK